MRRIALPSLLALGVLILSACGGKAPATTVPQAASSEGGARVDVTLADFTITSSMTAFKVGVPYTLVISNNSLHEHNFNISTPADVAGGLDAALQSALLSVGADKIPPGGSTTVNFTFPESAAGANLEFNCLIPRHYDAGMRLAITVTK
jgi:uncharacterized cupredoxin-like copper-binding protein